MEIYFSKEAGSDGFKERNSDPAKRIPCKAGKALCCISPEGDVSPCLLMPIILGSLRKQTMSEIWYQQENEFLNRLRTPDAYKSSPCVNCDLLKFCTRCSGVAYIETGDPFGQSPSACRYAEWRASRLK